ncbi:MAG: S-layer homology domain-containing protein [Candidatus Altimarinota bacterium]
MNTIFPENSAGKGRMQTILVMSLFVAVGLIVNLSLGDLQTNLIATKKAAPYDGTTMPIRQIPDWVGLSSDQWKLKFSEMPAGKLISAPEYKPEQLTIPSSSLNWSNAADRAIRNAQVTYSVPYMGSYKLNGKEYDGSHLAVDIKIPVGTPVFAIGNGVVTKVSQSDAGFGKHIVVRHDEFPSMDNANVKTTYHSSYSHLNSTLVQAGDIVSKGQQIAESGQSGTATTPHLHFQIDKDSVAWHPYWPFTSQEASNAGMDFFSAINGGLGSSAAIAATISPLAYVQKYTSGSASNNNSTGSDSGSNTSTEPNNDQLPPVNENTNTDTNTDEIPETEEEVVEEVPVVEEPVVEVVDVVKMPSKLELNYDKAFAVNSALLIKVVALDEDGKIIDKVDSAVDLYIKVENGSAKLDKTFLTAADFKNGIAEFRVTPKGEFGLKVAVEGNGLKYSTEILQASIFPDLNEEDDNFVAISFLKQNDVIRGYPDGTFKPENPVSRVEALKFIYEGLDKGTTGSKILPFSDTDSKAWYAKYVAAGLKDRVIQGYENNSFKPANQVTKAEFLKMLLESSGDGNVAVSENKPFSDVEDNSWYGKYFSIAKEKNLLDTSSSKANPHQALSRAEVAEILYRLMVIKNTNKSRFERSLASEMPSVVNF